jgi:hypothetical protein
MLFDVGIHVFDATDVFDVVIHVFDVGTDIFDGATDVFLFLLFLF